MTSLQTKNMRWVNNMNRSSHFRDCSLKKSEENCMRPFVRITFSNSHFKKYCFEIKSLAHKIGVVTFEFQYSEHVICFEVCFMKLSYSQRYLTSVSTASKDDYVKYDRIVEQEPLDLFTGFNHDHFHDQIERN